MRARMCNGQKEENDLRKIPYNSIMVFKLRREEWLSVKYFSVNVFSTKKQKSHLQILSYYAYN